MEQLQVPHELFPDGNEGIREWEGWVYMGLNK